MRNPIIIFMAKQKIKGVKCISEISRSCVRRVIHAKNGIKVETKLLYENMSIEFHILKNKSVTPVTVIDP